MKPNQLATLVLRLFGIYCLIQVIPAITISTSTVAAAQGFTYAQGKLDRSEVAMIAAMVMVALYLAFWLVVGILLIVRSVPWGEMLTPKDIGEGNITEVSFENIQTLVFAAAGVLIFAGALPQLLNSIFSFFSNTHQIIGGNSSGSTSYNNYNWRALLIAIGTLIKAALGLWLFFGARGFANFWRSLRTFGTPKSPQS